MAVKVQMVLFAVGIGAACVVMLGGIFGKSWAWTDAGPEGVGGWTDGAKPWAVWAILGGLLVVALLLVGRLRHDAAWLVAGVAAFSLWHAANEATAYRDRLEAGMFTMYDHHTLSFGLRVVPTAGDVGAIAVGALALITLVTTSGRRLAVGGWSQRQSGDCW